VEHRLPKRAIDHIVANSNKAAHCTHLVNDESWHTVEQFRKKVSNHESSLNNFAYQLCMDLVSESVHLWHKHNISSPPTAARRSSPRLSANRRPSMEMADIDYDSERLTAKQRKEVVEEAKKLYASGKVWLNSSTQAMARY
jgi:hypothetical protein